MGRGRRRQVGGRLRLEPLRGQPRQPGPWRVGRLLRRALHSPYPRVQPWHRLLLHHRRGVRAQRLMARPVRRLLSHGRLRVQQDLRTQTQRSGRLREDRVRERPGKGRAYRYVLRPSRLESGPLLHHLRQRWGGSPHYLRPGCQPGSPCRREREPELRRRTPRSRF